MSAEISGKPGQLKPSVQTNYISQIAGFHWPDSNADGLSDGWVQSTGTGTPSIISGGGFTGNAQRFVHTTGTDTNFVYNTGINAVSGVTYNIKFKYKNNGSEWRGYLRYSNDRFVSSIPYSATVADASYNITATAATEIRICFSKPTGYGTSYLDIDELQVFKL